MTTATPRRPIGSEPRPPAGRRPAHRRRPSGAPGAGGGVHPRIQRRRTEVAVTGRRRRRRRIAVVVAAVLLTATGALALFSPMLDVDRLDVRGVPAGDATLLRDVAEVPVGQAMVSVDPAEVRARVEALPWVAHAAVRRDWPDRLVITVSPQRPLALLAGADGEPTHVLTRSGEVVSAAEATPVLATAGALRVVHLGTDPSDVAVDELRSLDVLLSSFDEPSTALLGDVVRSGEGRYEVAGTGGLEGATVAIGDLDDLPEKIQAVRAMLGGAVDLACVRRLDVSVPPRVVMRGEVPCVAGGRPEDR